MRAPSHRGATAVAGLLNILDAGYGRNIAKAFGDSMFEGKTAGVAMTVAKNQVGQTQRDWWRRNFKTQYPATYKFDCYPKYVGKANGRLI